MGCLNVIIEKASTQLVVNISMVCPFAPEEEPVFCFVDALGRDLYDNEDRLLVYE